MQVYNPGFARVYNTRWAFFANFVAPQIHDFYAATPMGQENKSLLDLCCGTGQLAVYFLERGFRVVGIDLSEPMLHYAKENAKGYVESGLAEFVLGDAGDFKLDERFGLVVSTFDALNHLDSDESLINCFKCVYAVCDGYFIFDLNTRRGIRRWNNIQVDESSEDAVIVTRRIYDGQSDRAWTKITGFIGVGDGLFERFELTAFNTVFDMEMVKNALLEVGWENVYFARIQDLKTPITEPENEDRVFFVASK